MWFSAAWCLSNNSSVLQLIYDSTGDIINWSKDELWFFIKDPEMKSFHLNYLKNSHGKTDEEIEFNIADQYILDKSTFLKMEDSNVIWWFFLLLSIILHFLDLFSNSTWSTITTREKSYTLGPYCSYLFIFFVLFYIQRPKEFSSHTTRL